MTKKPIFEMSFLKSTRAGRGSYEKDGCEVHEITTADGRLFKKVGEGVEDEYFKVTGKTKIIDEQRQNFIVKISIFGEKVLPLEIFGNEVSYYTAKGYGFSGRSFDFYVYISRDESGKITAERSSESRINWKNVE